jgi:DNA polymerase V
MGAPVFKYRQLFREQGVVQFSANFDLYGDISERITRLLAEITPRIEVYSVDECFLDLTTLNIPNLEEWGKKVRQRIMKEIGIPVSIGIAASKTLAKLTAEHAKKQPELEGVLDFTKLNSEQKKACLLKTPVEDVWGVGRKLGPKLRAEGVASALDLANMRPNLAGALMGVHGRQMVAELNGTFCLPLELIRKTRQSIQHGRLFGEDTSNPMIIDSAIATLTARATYRLRREDLLTYKASVRLATNRQRPGYQNHYAEVQFKTPTADTGLIVSQLVEAVNQIRRPGLLYHRADIYMSHLTHKENFQTDLLGEVNVKQDELSQARSSALDALNARYGKRTVHYAAEDLSGRWKPKHQLRSPRYTTRWDELPILHLRCP